MAKADNKQLISKLLDTNDDDVLAAIELIKEKGNKDFIVPLFELLMNKPSGEVEDAVLELFYGLKDTAARTQFLNEFSNKKYTPIAHHLLGVLWNANIDITDKLAQIIKVGLSGNYEAIVEVYTIIETLEPGFEESELLEAIILCKDYINKNPKSDKLPLLNEMILRLHELDKLS